MDKNKKILLKIFDLDDDLVDDVSFETDINRNTLYVKFKKIITCCPVCDSLKLLSKGYYTSKLVWIVNTFLDNFYENILNSTGVL